MAVTYKINTVKNNMTCFCIVFLNTKYMHIIQNSKTIKVYSEDVLHSQSLPIMLLGFV